MNLCITDDTPLVPEGIYIVKFTHYDIGKSWNGCKVRVHFAIIDGDYAGTPLTRFYNAKALVGDSANGFTAPSRGALVREFRTLFADTQAQPDIDLNAYRDKLIRAKVETVGKDGLGQELAKPTRYSVIRKLIEIIPDDYEVLFGSSPKLG